MGQPGLHSLRPASLSSVREPPLRSWDALGKVVEMQVPLGLLVRPSPLRVGGGFQPWLLGSFSGLYIPELMWTSTATTSLQPVLSTAIFLVSIMPVSGQAIPEQNPVALL